MSSLFQKSLKYTGAPSSSGHTRPGRRRAGGWGGHSGPSALCLSQPQQPANHGLLGRGHGQDTWPASPQPQAKASGASSPPTGRASRPLQRPPEEGETVEGPWPCLACPAGVPTPDPSSWVRGAGSPTEATGSPPWHRWADSGRRVCPLSWGCPSEAGAQGLGASAAGGRAGRGEARRASAAPGLAARPAPPSWGP